jgi:hypothetical protein
MPPVQLAFDFTAPPPAPVLEPINDFQRRMLVRLREYGGRVILPEAQFIPQAVIDYALERGYCVRWREHGAMLTKLGEEAIAEANLRNAEKAKVRRAATAARERAELLAECAAAKAARAAARSGVIATEAA